jgi:hypothetical protein
MVKECGEKESYKKAYGNGRTGVKDVSRFKGEEGRI